MFGSWKLGKLAGIDVFVHGTFWLLPLFIFVTGSLDGRPAAAIGFDLAVVFALFGCVALHEVGHALAARYYGIGTRDITLYPIGGVASLERMPEKPGREIAIALAGPAVNFVIAGGLLVGLLGGAAAFPETWASPDPTLLDFVARLFAANLFLACFNLLPAFPMDGGRVLRALLSVSFPRVRATEIAVTVSGVMALLFFAAGLLLPQLTLAILAVAVFLLGKAELAHVRHTGARRDWERRSAGYFAPAENLDAFTGWRFDPARRVWTEWRGGVPVREVHGF
jgi:Zn-dependent protease